MLESYTSAHYHGDITQSQSAVKSTEDRVVIQRHCNMAEYETDEVLLDGYLISHFQTGLKNLLDTAILNSTDFHQKDLAEKFKKLDEIPFNSTRRIMSAPVENPSAGLPRLVDESSAPPPSKGKECQFKTQSWSGATAARSVQ
jgi:magnesium-transporting ATPase (P-type)